MADESKEPQAHKSPESGAEGSPPATPSAGSRPDAPATPPVTPPAKPVAPAAPAKPPVVLQTPLNNEMVARYRAKFGEAILEAIEDRKQAILVAHPKQFREIARYSRDEEKFDMLADLTAVDWPKREKRFDVVLALYSFALNTRLRLKVPVGAAEEVSSMVDIWPAANWLEREVYDLFGIVFAGHPDLKRILLPEEWQGYPLRKDYDILTQDTDWVRENLGIKSGQ